MSRLSRYQSTLNKWGLTENPFRATPPVVASLNENVMIW